MTFYFFGKKVVMMFEWLLDGGSVPQPDGFTELTELTELTAQSLSDAVGWEVGTLINEGTKWITTTFAGKEIIFPAKPIRMGISWHDIYLRGAVYGTDDAGPYPYTEVHVIQNRRVTFEGKTYRVRLMRGADDMLTSTRYNTNQPGGTLNSEYHHTIIALYDAGKYSLEDLGFGYQGSYAGVWCMESHTWNSNRGRVLRGRTSIYNFGATYGDYRGATSSGYTTWRPVLELAE